MHAPRGGVPTGLAAGVLGAHVLFFHGIPVLWPAALLLVLARTFRATVPAALAIGLALAEQALEAQLADRLEPALAGARLEVTGTIDGLPETYASYTRFRFRPADGSALPTLILAYWYRDAPPLVPGSTWQLELVVKPPSGEVNFHGGDRERWLFAEGIGALATVRSGQMLDGHPRGAPWHRWRHASRERIASVVPEGAPRGVLLALAIADRSEVRQEDQQILAATGTAHLLSISGLHVALAAMYGFWLARLLLVAVPTRFGGSRLYPLCTAAGGSCALTYAALAGFGTATLRALIMLLVALLAMMARRGIDAGRAWLLALAAVLLADPLAPLQAPFWLSFGAVAVLIALLAPRRGAKFWHGLLLTQLGILLAMLPLNAWWFQIASPSGLLANLVAIPWVSFATVPLTLLGLALLPFGGTVMAGLFGLAARTCDWLSSVLGLIAALPGAMVTLPQPSLVATLLAACAGFTLLLPRGVPLRRLAIVWMLPLLVMERPVPPGAMRLDVLDAGQGSAVLLATEDRLLLYDAGPGDGADYDRVAAVIEPAIRALGRRTPDRIVVSHGDLDHAGGLPALQERYPRTPVLASLPSFREGVAACHDGLGWNWDGAGFRVLHPSRYLRYLGNDASCVVSIRRGTQTVLLPGDISQVVESRIAGRGLEPHAVLLVPHHGSSTSSSPELLAALRPRIAIATAALGNRFGFPRMDVRKRFRAAGVPLWATGECGALRVEFDASGSIGATSARRARAAPWRWPAGPDCP